MNYKNDVPNAFSFPVNYVRNPGNWINVIDLAQDEYLWLYDFTWLWATILCIETALELHSSQKIQGFYNNWSSN